MHIITHGTSTLEAWSYGDAQDLEFKIVILWNSWTLKVSFWFTDIRFNIYCTCLVSGSRMWWHHDVLQVQSFTWGIVFGKIWKQSKYFFFPKLAYKSCYYPAMNMTLARKREDISPCRRYSRALKVRSTWKRDENSPRRRKLLTTQHYIYEVDTKKRWQRKKQSLAEKQLWDTARVTCRRHSRTALEHHPSRPYNPLNRSDEQETSQSTYMYDLPSAQRLPPNNSLDDKGTQRTSGDAPPWLPAWRRASCLSLLPCPPSIIMEATCHVCLRRESNARLKFRLSQPNTHTN